MGKYKTRGEADAARFLRNTARGNNFPAGFTEFRKVIDSEPRFGHPMDSGANKTKELWPWAYKGI